MYVYNEVSIIYILYVLYDIIYLYNLYIRSCIKHISLVGNFTGKMMSGKYFNF